MRKQKNKELRRTAGSARDLWAGLADSFAFDATCKPQHLRSLRPAVIGSRPAGDNNESSFHAAYQMDIMDNTTGLYSGYEDTSRSTIAHDNDNKEASPIVHDPNILGAGGFSVVRKAVRRKDGLKVAVKCIQRKNLSPNDVANLEREVRILQEINHPHVMSLLDVFDEGAETIFLVTQFAEGGDLFDAVQSRGHLSEPIAKRIMFILLNTVHHMHKVGVFHRDLKLENILLLSKLDKDTKIMLADFGLAEDNITANSKRVRVCGTPEYMPPEIVSRKPSGPKVDIWCCGVIMFALLCGYLPFAADIDPDSTVELYNKIREGIVVFDSPNWDGISDRAKDLISSMLTLDPNARPEAKTLLQHRWFGSMRLQIFNDPTSSIYKLRTWQARRRFRFAILVIIALIRFYKSVYPKISFSVLLQESSLYNPKSRKFAVDEREASCGFDAKNEDLPTPRSRSGRFLLQRSVSAGEGADQRSEGGQDSRSLSRGLLASDDAYRRGGGSTVRRASDTMTGLGLDKTSQNIGNNTAPSKLPPPLSISLSSRTKSPKQLSEDGQHKNGQKKKDRPQVPYSPRPNGVSSTGSSNFSIENTNSFPRQLKNNNYFLGDIMEDGEALDTQSKSNDCEERGNIVDNDDDNSAYDSKSGHDVQHRIKALNHDMISLITSSSSSSSTTTTTTTTSASLLRPFPPASSISSSSSLPNLLHRARSDEESRQISAFLNEEEDSASGGEEEEGRSGEYQGKRKGSYTTTHYSSSPALLRKGMSIEDSLKISSFLNSEDEDEDVTDASRNISDVIPENNYVSPSSPPTFEANEVQNEVLFELDISDGQENVSTSSIGVSTVTGVTSQEEEGDESGRVMCVDAGVTVKQFANGGVITQQSRNRVTSADSRQIASFLEEDDE